MIVAVAAGGSAALLLAAFAFEHLGGMAPCELCLWQRWPHAGAVVAGAVALAIPAAFLLLAGALGAMASAGIGVYHTGVERGWWAGPEACAAGGDITGMSAEALLDAILAAPVVRCDEVAWEMFGLSMASWNAVASLTLAAIWLFALRRPA